MHAEIGVICSSKEEFSEVASRLIDFEEIDYYGEVIEASEEEVDLLFYVDELNPDLVIYPEDGQDGFSFSREARQQARDKSRKLYYANCHLPFILRDKSSTIRNIKEQTHEA